MRRLLALACALAICVLLCTSANADLFLFNGNFDEDADLGGGDDTRFSPAGWFSHYNQDQTWSDFRFGNDGNGGWDNNGITFGQNFLGPNFDPGPEDGYYYTRLGSYGGEVGARVNGFGYNRVRNDPGQFDVGIYFTPAGTFSAADSLDPAASGVKLGSKLIDIQGLVGSTPQSQAFDLTVSFPGSGIAAGDDVWLRFGDGPDNGDLNTFDEPTIDNVTLTVLVPEPHALAAVAGAGALALRRRRTS
jgi:MYXO-CTERM domain-containing protein